jgi:hypothetical protein
VETIAPMREDPPSLSCLSWPPDTTGRPSRRTRRPRRCYSTELDTIPSRSGIRAASRADVIPAMHGRSPA